MKKAGYYLLVTMLILSLLVSIIGCTTTQRLRMATTTSLYDTGLWEYLEPMFEKEYDVELDVMYAGTGKALEYGRRGDVDIITIHDKAREEQFVAEGNGIKRVPFAYNYFLIVGPPDDPTSIKGLRPEEAFQKLMETSKGKFISRGDDSGTHAKEKAIWKKAGYEYESIQKAGSWYIEAGSGMGPTLMMASEKEAYTLTDMGTYLAYKGKLALVPIVDRGDVLLNVYAAIVINPETHPKVKIDIANQFINWLMSDEVQDIIGTYGETEYGRSLFFPIAGCDMPGCPPVEDYTTPVPEYAK